MTAPDAAELIALCDDILEGDRSRSGYLNGSWVPEATAEKLARALKSILSAPTEGEVAEAERLLVDAKIQVLPGDIGYQLFPMMYEPIAALPLQDFHAIVNAGFTLLRYIKSRALQGNATIPEIG